MRSGVEKVTSWAGPRHGGMFFAVSIMNHMQIKIGKGKEGKKNDSGSSFNLPSQKLLHDTKNPRGFLIV